MYDCQLIRKWENVMIAKLSVIISVTTLDFETAEHVLGRHSGISSIAFYKS